MHGSQQLTRGATFQAVDNGGDRNCHFLGFTRISKFFVYREFLHIVKSIKESLDQINIDLLHHSLAAQHTFTLIFVYFYHFCDV